MKFKIIFFITFLLCFVILEGCSMNKPSTKQIAEEKDKPQLTAFDDVKVENKEFGEFPVHIVANYSSMNGSTMTWLSENDKWSKHYDTDSGNVFLYKDTMYIFGDRTWTLYKFNFSTAKATNLNQELSPYFVAKLSKSEVVLTNREGGDSSRQRIYIGEPWNLKKGIMVPGSWGTGWRDSKRNLWIATDNNEMDNNGDSTGGYIHLLSENGQKLIKTFQTSTHNFSSHIKLSNGEYLVIGFPKWLLINPKEMTIKEMEPPIDNHKYQVNDTFETNQINVLLVSERDLYPTDYFKIIFLDMDGKITKQLEINYPYYPKMTQLIGSDLYIASQIENSVQFGGVVARIDLQTGKVVAQRFIPLPSDKDLSFVQFSLY